MNAEILCVGTEILLGDIVNTNAAYLAKGLAACGIGCYSQTVVGDNPKRLRQALEHSLSRANVVITTGGLGPTYDDLTKETVADCFGLPMEMDQPTLDHLHSFFSRLGREMTPNNEKQALMPRGATIFHNDRGTAPGLAVEGNGKTVILLPGPPREMTAMFDDQVRPYLLERSSTTLVSHTIHLFGIGESMVEHQLNQFMQNQENPTVAPYAKEGEVQLRVTASAESTEKANEMMKPVIEEISHHFSGNIYGIDVETLENALVQALLEKKLTVAVAESCTGGLLGKRITDIPGASRVFLGGATTYSNGMKERVLEVSHETLEAHGAVSTQTAAEMAEGARRMSGADLGISVTGIAGPDGGSEEKPVGYICIGVSTAGGTTVKEHRLGRGYGGERPLIRHLAASNALYQGLLAVQKYEK